MSIGDIHSAERGSGARYNSGKPNLALIPVQLIARSHTFDAVVHNLDVKQALAALGLFQTECNVRHLDYALALMRPYWRDCAKVFEYGQRKYAAWNWAKGMPWSATLACAARHALAILEGEELDPESGERHHGHFMCNLVMLRTFVDTYPEGNDLPPAHLFRRDLRLGPAAGNPPDDHTT
jgi:hypothetical protein